MALSVKRIEKLKDKHGRHGDGHGLYLQVPKREDKRPDGKVTATWAGAPSWLFRYERDGRERWLGLGSMNAFDLSEARDRARKMRQLLADGIDPAAARKAERAERALAIARTVTFKEAAQAYFDAHNEKWRNDKHRDQYLSTMRTYVEPEIGRLPVAEIDTGLVLKVIEPIWKDKTETADRIRGRIARVLDFATVRGWRVGDNPARWRGHLENVLPARSQVQKVEHHPALPYDNLPEFMSKLRERTGTAARALEFTILTCARTGETIGARWPEIDWDKKLWTIPADRIKGGKEHRVPLSDRAVALLKALPREKGNDHVFIGPTSGRGLSNMAMAAVMERMGVTDATVHGFRSTFRSWAAETTNHPREVCEMALAHVVGDAVERAYQRGDMFEKRRRLARDWERYCASPPRRGNNVVPINRSAAE